MQQIDPWKNLKRSRFISWVTFAMFIPWMLFMHFVLPGQGHFSFLVYIGVAAPISYLTLKTPCPRCGKSFGSTFWVSDSFFRKCLHCGVKMGAALK